RAMTGLPPAGWGTAEPVTEYWRPAELSLVAAGRAPLPTSLIIVGGGERAAIGMLEITPDGRAVTESATFAVSMPAPLADEFDLGGGWDELASIAERLRLPAR